MWPGITYETCSWERDSEELSRIPKSARRKISPVYEAAVPAKISNQELALPSEISERAADLRASIARFDEKQFIRGYNLPALMLRSESSSSSQIERLTSSVKNVALAELTEKTPRNAQLIAGNIAAMRIALSQEGPLRLESIESIQRTLMGGTGESIGIRDEQVWIGGSAYSPHGALFVPPHPTRVETCLGDLIAFSYRQNIDPIVKAAVFHAQFETVHPFTDGNGRTGRALLHRMLAEDGILKHTTIPVSAGLLHDVDGYMSALSAYHAGEIVPIIERLLEALELAFVLGSHIADDVNAVLIGWREKTTDRKGSAAHRLPALLVEQPVVDSAYVAKHLSITERAARTLINAACERDILKKMSNAKRGAFYQAIDLIAILEEASSVSGIRRIAAR